MHLWSVYEPRPWRKFSGMALRTQQCDPNTRRNNLRFLHGTATYGVTITVADWKCFKFRNAVHPRLSEPWLSDTLIIRTLIIWHLDYLNLEYLTPWLSECKISQATPTFTKAMWVVAIAKYCKKWHFPIVKAMQSAENVLNIKEKLDIHKLMPATDRSYTKCYRSRQSTIVARFWNGWHRWISLMRTNSLIWTLPKCTITEGVRITEDAL